MKRYSDGVFYVDGVLHEGQTFTDGTGKKWTAAEAAKETIAYGILDAHHTEAGDGAWHLKFDSITSHDITYVGIIQTARASGMTEFPIPYVMTNCHNSLCAVGGTINEDDHKFALSAAKKYGGIYVPPNLGVIHSVNREMMAGCGKMILGSDSHTRYGALGTMAVGEGGGELAKQLLEQTYDIPKPPVILVHVVGEPDKSVGPHDVALQLVKETFEDGFVKNAVLEFVGPGIEGLSVEFRNGIDVMTTETTCWTSIWETDEKIKAYLTEHGRPEDYAKLQPGPVAYYDRAIELDLSAIKPSIALPFHPSNVYTIEEVKADPEGILKKAEIEAQKLFENTDIQLDFMRFIRDGKIYVDQGIVVGCSGGTFDSICDAASILKGQDTGNGSFSMSVYPGSQPAYLELVRNGAIAELMQAGVTVKSAFCGPCFGAGDTPANGELSIRHATRNFPNREGSKPNEGQYTAIALMDAKSIAATARNHGFLTGADEIDFEVQDYEYKYDPKIYESRVYNGFDNPQPEVDLVFGPNIKDWPEMPELTDHLLVKVVSHIDDPVTTTDELIPSGETSSYRSNPLRLAEFTLSRKDPNYVPAAKAVKVYEDARVAQDLGQLDDLAAQYDQIEQILGQTPDRGQIGIGSAVFAKKPGDGSAREQAASSQKVLGGWANFAIDYATKRYRSNLINWGILPFVVKNGTDFPAEAYVFVPNIKAQIEGGAAEVTGYILSDAAKVVQLELGILSERERGILSKGSLINYNRK